MLKIRIGPISKVLKVNYLNLKKEIKSLINQNPNSNINVKNKNLINKLSIESL